MTYVFGQQFGDLPGLPGIPGLPGAPAQALALAVENRGGLACATAASKAIAQQALPYLTFTPDQTPTPGSIMSGTVSAVAPAGLGLPQGGLGPLAKTLVDAGGLLLVERQPAVPGSLSVIGFAGPSQAAAAACAFTGGESVLFDAKPEVEAALAKLLGGAQPPPPSPIVCPPGSVKKQVRRTKADGSEYVTEECVPTGGETPVTPEKAGLPSWALPAGVIAALAISLIALASGGRK